VAGVDEDPWTGHAAASGLQRGGLQVDEVDVLPLGCELADDGVEGRPDAPGLRLGPQLQRGDGLGRAAELLDLRSKI